MFELVALEDIIHFHEIDKEQFLEIGVNLVEFGDFIDIDETEFDERAKYFTMYQPVMGAVLDSDTQQSLYRPKVLSFPEKLEENFQELKSEPPDFQLSSDFHEVTQTSQEMNCLQYKRPASSSSDFYQHIITSPVKKIKLGEPFQVTSDFNAISSELHILTSRPAST